MPALKAFCFNCKHSRHQEDGTFCRIYQEMIMVESEAADCSFFVLREDVK